MVTYSFGTTYNENMDKIDVNLIMTDDRDWWEKRTYFTVPTKVR